MCVHYLCLPGRKHGELNNPRAPGVKIIFDKKLGKKFFIVAGFR